MGAERNAVFGWSKLRGRRKAKAARRLPRRVLAPVEEIVEQGLLVADVAVRMTVKNAIIMNALKQRADYDRAQIVGMVESAIEDLATERERDARHIKRMLREIRDTGWSSWSEAGYSSEDSRTLRHRLEVYEGVAKELRERCDDRDYLTETAERSRELAWGEIGDSLKERATHPYYSGGDTEEYQEARDERIQLLIERDLTELVQQQSSAPTKPRRRTRKGR